jgi:hypothetical protein
MNSVFQQDHDKIERVRSASYLSEDDSAIKEAVGLFKTVDDLQAAIRDLEGIAFPRQDISVMGKRKDLEKVFGSKTVCPELAMDHPETPRQAPSRPEEQTIGTAAIVGVPAYVGAMALAITAGAVTFPAMIGAAVIGGIGGGTLGAVLSKIWGGRYNRHIEEQIRKGGLLLWVRTPDKEKEELAKHILISNGGYDVHIHKTE